MLPLTIQFGVDEVMDELCLTIRLRGAAILLHSLKDRGVVCRRYSSKGKSTILSIYISCFSVRGLDLRMEVNLAMVSVVCFLTKSFELNILIQTPKNLVEPSSGFISTILEPNLIGIGCDVVTVLVKSCDFDLLMAALVIE